VCEHLKYVYDQKSVEEHVGVAYGSPIVPLTQLLISDSACFSGFQSWYKIEEYYQSLQGV